MEDYFFVTKSENGAILGRKNRQIKNAALVTFNLNFKKKKTFLKRFSNVLSKNAETERHLLLSVTKNKPQKRKDLFFCCVVN